MDKEIESMLMEHNELREVVKTWELLSIRDKLQWNGECARRAIRDAVNPTLAKNGAVRIRLLDSPDRFDTRSLRKLLASLAKQFGFLLPQTHANNLTALIRNEGKDYRSHETRGHQTNSELSFHSDRCDLNVLLYVRGANRGGEVSIVSYEKAARRLEQKNPAALAMLFENFPFDLREERIFPTPDWYVRPVFWMSESKQLRGHYIRRFINDSQRHSACPRLSSEQCVALDELDATLCEIRKEHSFSPVPGELVILDNYRVMHARERYSDTEGDNKGRLLIRTWVAPFISETLPEFLFPMTGALASGCFRGGVGRGQQYLNLLGKFHQQLQLKANP